ncbi:MAG: phosphotransferase [Pseudomonadota bacterium]
MDGQPVSETIQTCTTRRAQLAVLTKCGAWLDAFHRCQFERRRFRPGHTLKYYGTLRQDIETRKQSVPARGLFLQGIDRLSDVAPRCAGFETIAAVQHGDFHLRNLIWRDGQVAGIDISKDQLAPVGYDIAKVLLDFTSVFSSAEKLPEGGLVHSDTLEAFFKGYRLVDAQDPSVNFLMYARILATLFTVPAHQNDRNTAKKRTLRRLKPIALHAFRRDNSDASPESHGDKQVVFLLTKDSLARARRGEHDFSNALKSAVKKIGYTVTHRRNTPHNRARLARDDLTLVHMSAPVGRRGLVFRQAYAGPFWHLERRAERWEWDIARAPFAAADIDAAQALAFFETWRDRLVPDDTPAYLGDPFIYMPLQGKLFKQRRFQRASPLNMIQTTLQQTDVMIKATLHPSEDYAQDELDALDAIAQANARFQVVTLPMHEALAGCSYVVTENSSAAFHAVFHEKPAILFAGIDFHHICAAFDPARPAAAFADVHQPARPFREFLFWYWAMNAIDMSATGFQDKVLQRLTTLGWFDTQ